MSPLNLAGVFIFILNISRLNSILNNLFEYVCPPPKGTLISKCLNFPAPWSRFFLKLILTLNITTIATYSIKKKHHQSKHKCTYESPLLRLSSFDLALKAMQSKLVSAGKRFLVFIFIFKSKNKANAMCPFSND